MCTFLECLINVVCVGKMLFWLLILSSKAVNWGSAKNCIYGNGWNGDLLRLSVVALANWSGFVILKYYFYDVNWASAYDFLHCLVRVVHDTHHVVMYRPVQKIQRHLYGRTGSRSNNTQEQLRARCNFSFSTRRLCYSFDRALQVLICLHLQMPSLLLFHECSERVRFLRYQQLCARRGWGQLHVILMSLDVITILWICSGSWSCCTSIRGLRITRSGVRFQQPSSWGSRFHFLSKAREALLFCIILYCIVLYCIGAGSLVLYIRRGKPYVVCCFVLFCFV